MLATHQPVTSLVLLLMVVVVVVVVVVLLLLLLFCCCCCCYLALLIPVHRSYHTYSVALFLKEEEGCSRHLSVL